MSNKPYLNMSCLLNEFFYKARAITKCEQGFLGAAFETIK